MAITIKQIAAQAGVSRGTVDRVLHNRPGVNPQVAEHVRKIADELGFLPNRAGKILAARKQPLTIGCFFPGIGNAFFDNMAAGFYDAQTEFAHYGVSVLLGQVEGYDATAHITAIRELVDQNCGALCVSTIDIPEIRAYVNEIVASGIPVVAVNNDLTHTGRLCYVGCDYRKGGSTAAGLLSLMVTGKLNLLIVTGSLKMKGHNDRVRGFSQTLREKRVDYRLVDIFESLDNDEHAYHTALKVLKEHPEINCVYIAAAGVAGTCRAIVDLGRQNDLYVLSYDDIATIRQLVEDGIIDFTICQEPWLQGYKSIQLLFDYFVGDKKHAPDDYITNTVIKIQQNIN